MIIMRCFKTAVGGSMKEEDGDVIGWNSDSEGDNSEGDNSVAMAPVVAGMVLSFILLATLPAIILVCLKW